MNNFTEQILYHYILTNSDLYTKIRSEFFGNKNLQLLYKYAQEYVLKYKTVPSATQIKDLIKIDGKSDLISDEIIDVLYSTQGKLSEYSDDWLYKTSTNWGKWQNFTISLRNLVAFVKSVDVTEDNVEEVMERAKSAFNNTAILQIDESLGSDFYNPTAHKQSKLLRTPTGYKFIDDCLDGGSWEGSFIVFVGDPKSGKSLWLQNICAQSILSGDDCAYISLELPEEMIMQRIGSNLFGIPALDYKRVSEDEVYMKQKINSFINGGIRPRGNLWVKSFPTSTMTAHDLETCILKEEERRSIPGKPFKFKKIFVDYINIMKNWRNPNSENTYLKIKQIAEDTKAVGIANHWAIFTATQTKRDAFNAADMQVTDVSESVGLNATVDAMFGIIADQMMKAQGVYNLKSLLNRVKDTTNQGKKFLWDKIYLRITEDENSNVFEFNSSFANLTNRNNIQKSNNYQQNVTQVNNINNENKPEIGITTPTDIISISGNGIF